MKEEGGKGGNMHTLMKHWVGGLVGDGCGGFDGEAGPFLHGGAVDVLFGVLLCVSGFFDIFSFSGYQVKVARRWLYIESHPGNGFIFRDWCPLDELDGELLVVKGESEDCSWRRPGADHEVVDGHCWSLELWCCSRCAS